MARPQRTNETKLLADRYEIVDLIGSGTAADVFRVRDRQSGVLRAAKVLKPENAANPKILARFEDEFRILRTLHHPHLPEVYDYGWTEDGGRFLIMELVDGVSLDEYFRANPADIWAVLYELCETLTFVHDHKLLHQDIKPSNILVKRTTAYGPDLPLVKLIDFGLIYKRDAGAAVELVGTPAYVAPEVVRGEASLTRAVDYYSLGATLFELLTGHPPFVGAVRDVLRAQVEREPVIDDEKLEWAELYPHVRALLTKDRRARLEAFEEFRRAVTSRLTGGIDELDRAYGLARVESTAIAGKEVDEWLARIDAAVSSGGSQAPALDISGRSGTARNHLLDTVCAECAMRGFQVVRFGRESGTDVLKAEGQRLGQVERFSRAMSRFEESRSQALLMVVDGIERLGDDEGGFIRYVSTRRALTTDTQKPFIFLIAHGPSTTSHPLDPYLPAERHYIQMPADRTPAEKGEDDEDIRAQVMASGVWARSDARRRLLAYVASHPAPVSIAWAKEFVGISATGFADDVDQLVARHLMHRVVVDGIDAIQVSDDSRAVVQGVVSPEIRAQAHRDFVGRLTRSIESSGRGSSSVYDLIAHHYAAVGDDRSALVARIRAVKAAWREHSLSTVERLSQASLDALARSSTIHAKAARRHFVRQWVQALWARNQHTRAKQVIDDHILKHGDAVPPSLLAKYIRATLDAEEPASTLQFLDMIELDALSTTVKEQILLEKALVLWHSAQHEQSLSVLDVLRHSVALSTRDRYRVTIYRAMNMSSLAAHEQIEGLLKETTKQARTDGCYDEYVLMSAMRAQTQIVLGRPRDALRAIAETLPFAHRHELYLRTNLLYRLSAAAYQDVGLPRKAISSQRKAIALASALGLPQFEAMSWSRLSEYERILGNFGNALRYLRKASTVIGTSSYEADRARLNLTELRLHSWLRSPELPEILDNAAWVEHISNLNERGRYFMMLGSYWADEGDWGRAWSCSDKASELLRRTGFVDNQILLSRTRLRLALAAGDNRRSEQERRDIDSQAVKTAASANVQIERCLGLLEYAFCHRGKLADVTATCEECLRLCNESTEATSRLEALSLIFRTYARYRRYDEARSAFKQFYQLLKSVTSNLDDCYIKGLMERLELDQLTREYELMERRNKAGVAASLVG